MLEVPETAHGRWDCERLLRRFERAGSSHPFGGLGLGLSIANEIARAHGGGIVSESQPRPGATSTLTLRRQQLAREAS